MGQYMKFEWDDEKNKVYILKHNLDFEDAKELFINGFWTVEDNRVDYAEKRIVGFGYIGMRLMCVVYTERKPEKIRIISFRKANKREVDYYEKFIKN